MAAINPNIDNGRSQEVPSNASVVLTPRRSSRRFLQIQNIGAVDVYINVDAAAGNEVGNIVLKPAGSMTFMDKYVPQNEFQGRAASGTAKVSVWEDASV